MAPPKKAVASNSNSDSKTYKVGDIVLGRLKGYPKWPSRVAGYDSLPAKVQSARPSVNPSIHCVQFFPVGDYAWLPAREIEPLPQHQIQAWLQEDHRKQSGDLKKAYQVALDPTEWDAGQKTAQAEEDEGRDELEDEEDEDGEAKSGAKRKKPASSKKAPAKKAKTEAKTKTDSKATAKRPKQGGSSKQPESKAAPVENQASADDDPLASDPVCIKVKDWRHKLQRTFLGKAPPATSDMDAQDELFKSIEAYKDITVDALQYSKIGKVMKKICSLDNIPRNDELKITDRARQLMEGWSEVITKHEAANGHANGGTANGNDDAAPISAAAPEAKKEDAAPAKPASKAAPAPAPAAADSSEKKEEAAAPAESGEKKEVVAEAPAAAAAPAVEAPNGDAAA